MARERTYYNAYILDWTVNGYAGLKQKLKKADFLFVKEKDILHLRVRVPFGRVPEFADIIRQHLNASYNYVDVQFPEEKRTVLVFLERVAIVSNAAENETARKWAVARGLPPEQADWATSY